MSGNKVQHNNITYYFEEVYRTDGAIGDVIVNIIDIKKFLDYLEPFFEIMRKDRVNRNIRYISVSASSLNGVVETDFDVNEFCNLSLEKLQVMDDATVFIFESDEYPEYVEFELIRETD